MTSRFSLAALLLASVLPAADAQEVRTAADQWVGRVPRYPPFVPAEGVRPSAFERLGAEAVAGLLIITWQPAPDHTNGAATLFVSADEPGHWAARDWRGHQMIFRGGRWETSPPVEDLDVPLVYFVARTVRSVTNASPMRVCRPRAAGLQEPTRVFWPFLDGFEEGTDNWSVLTPAAPGAELRADTSARSGHGALFVSIPSNHRSVTVATTRVRGWQIRNNFATGLRLWLRTRQGTGRARFTLHSNAFTTREMVATSSIEAEFVDRWQRVDLPFTSFPALPLGLVDLFTVELIGVGPRDFLLDDLQLLGRWRLVPE